MNITQWILADGTPREGEQNARTSRQQWMVYPLKGEWRDSTIFQWVGVFDISRDEHSQWNPKSRRVSHTSKRTRLQDNYFLVDGRYMTKKGADDKRQG